MRERLFWLWCIAFAIAIADQGTKKLVIETLSLYEAREVIPGMFNIVHVRNTGVAFSMFAQEGSPLLQWIFAAIGLAAVLILNVLAAKAKGLKKHEVVPLGLICGGALGNLTDRLFRGSVVDFLDFYARQYHWPAFNVADIGITCGAILIAANLFPQKHGLPKH